MDQERTAIFADATRFPLATAESAGLRHGRDLLPAIARMRSCRLWSRSSRRRRAGKPGGRRRSLPGLAVGGVEASEGVGARAELGLAEPIERRLDGVETLVHIVGIGVDEQEPGDDLAQRVALLKVGQR
jgi:hypothetical protein